MDNIYSVQVQLTRKCNQRCYMCRKYTWPMKEISIEKLETIFKEHKKATFTFSGGDPLSYSNIDELNKLLKKYNIKYQVLTNANYVLTEEQKEFLLNAKYVQISFDASNIDTYKSIRNPIENGFLTVVDNIKYLLKKGKIVKLNSTISKKNYNEVYGIIAFVYYTFKCISDNVQLRLFPVHTFSEVMLNESMMIEVESQSKHAKKNFGDDFVYISDMKKDEYKGKCYIKMHHRIIDEDGVEYPCCRAINDNGFDVEQRNKIQNLEELNDENVLYDFCGNCDRYRKFNENWEHVEKSIHESDGVFL